ncbi:MAG: YqaA family protein [Actinomycetota bacterium]
MSLHKLLLKITAWITALKTLGGWGLLLIACIDSLAIPMPIDALVAAYAYSAPYKAWIYCIAAALGSAVGCLLPYGLGRAGGELFLLKRIDQKRLEKIRDRFEKQEFLAMMLPAMLPPPMPFKLFVFSAGVFEMKLTNFLLAILCGRLIRFSVVSVLAVMFGKEVVTEVEALFARHPWVVLLFLVVFAAGGYLMWRLLRAPAAEVRTELERHDQENAQEENRGQDAANHHSRA